MWFSKKIKPEQIKAKNTKALQSMGIDVIDHLPYLDDPDFRDSKEVAKRMMILLALFQLHLGAPTEIIKNWIEKNGLQNYLTEEEKKFLKSNFKELPEQDKIDIYWYIEAIWAFAWIGGLHNNLTFNSEVEDTLAAMLPDIKANDSADQFINNFKIRNSLEVFEMLDRFYRAHWFSRNNSLTGKVSDKADLDLIIERRKALEYVCYQEYVWDDISLDT